MIRAASLALEELPLALRRGRFVASFRNRPIGEERVEWGSAPSGGLGLHAETTLRIPRFSLRQVTTAEFDGALRPRLCRITVECGSQNMQVEVEIEEARAFVRSRFGDVARSRELPLAREPLLLADNCFALHALAGLVASRRGAGEVFASIPAFENLTITAPGDRAVLLGGRMFDPPAVTLHLTSSVEEHVWIAGGWAERLIAPQSQICVDWIGNVREDGGSR